MSRDMLLWDETLFRDPQVLEIDYVPEDLLHRENQMQSLVYCIKPALGGMRPVNCLLTGPPGTGKTSAVLKIFEEVEKRSDDVVVLKINCQIDSTRFAVASRIYRKLFNVEPPSSGVAFRKLFEKIVQRLIEKDKVMVVCLDDINYLFHEGHADEVMYSILRAHELFLGAKIGVIAVVSDTGKLYRFDPKVSSVFLPEEIEFLRYNYHEIKDIIASRVRLAFYPDVFSKDAQELVVDYVDSIGDLRIGIDLLKRSALNAEKRASRTVEIEDVEKAYESSRLLNLKRVIMPLSADEKKLLAIIAGMGRSKAGDIYEQFHEVTGLGYTRFYEIVNKLAELQHLDATFSGEGMRGRTRLIGLSYPPEDVLKCLKG
ncbi:ORC1-type DNA replication protein [Methanohalophilus sp.]|uniref:ORC1-type DNA replication protein n=1 Tax=Methanohalophilus sp. TaxID=1966352 RepID=UPI0026391C38|nr:ORC1-type DNA replication protein [Methanohalophilus sp.]